jgi:hypothetical protein
LPALATNSPTRGRRQRSTLLSLAQALCTLPAKFTDAQARVVTESILTVFKNSADAFALQPLAQALRHCQTNLRTRRRSQRSSTSSL